MDSTLGYLRESLSNYTEEQQIVQQIYDKINAKNYSSEGEFVRELDEVEIKFLNRILLTEIEYAKNGNDQKRAKELNEVFELLF